MYGLGHGWSRPGLVLPVPLLALPALVALGQVGGSDEILNRKNIIFILRKLNVHDRQVVFG